MTLTYVPVCPRCGESHEVRLAKLTFDAFVTVQQAHTEALPVARWTHWGMCPTHREPFFYGAVPSWEGVVVEEHAVAVTT